MRKSLFGNRVGVRQALVTLTVTVVALAAVVAALRIAPQQPRPQQAAMTDPTPSSTLRVPDSSSPPTVGTSTAPPTRPAQQTTRTLTPSSGPGKPAERFADWVYEVAGWLDIPKRAMRSYASATATMQREQPDCNLSWVTLAGIGKIASDHGRIGSRTLDEQGRVSAPIGTIEVRDFSGDVISVPGSAGPLQLAPGVWDGWAAAASGAEPNVQDIDDAALTAARALCAGGRDLATGDGWLAALSTLQDAPLYTHRVLATATVYGTVGERSQPPDPAALRAVTFAIDKIGLPYVWGGNGATSGDAGFDCSGLTKAAYATAGVSIPRTAHTQYEAAPRVPAEQSPRLGDLIFYGTSEHIHHVGIYIGNRQMIDAPTFGQAVQVHRYRTQGDDFVSAGRPTN